MPLSESQKVDGNGDGGAREFVEGWTLAQTLGEGAYGEWVDTLLYFR